MKESPVHVNEVKLDSDDDSKMLSTRCSSTRSERLCAKQACRCSLHEYALEKESLFVPADENITYRNCLGQCVCKAKAFLKKPIRYFINLERHLMVSIVLISEEMGYLA